MIKKEIFDDDSMVNFASQKIGHSDYHKYISLLFKQIEVATLFDNEEEDLIEILSFTSAKFEFYATQKGIENMNNYLNQVELWRQKYNEFNHKNNPFAIQLAKQIDEKYINKMINKLHRYEVKLDLLRQII